MDYNKDRAENLIKLLLKNPKSRKAGVLMNDLLTEFHQGYPLDNLRPLLLNQNPDVAATGTWIASELGEKGKPLLSEISSLLRHAEKRVRFSAIDCILVWAGPSQGREVASTIQLLNDPEPGVRWKAMDFLARATQEQLKAALAHLEKTDSPSLHLPPLRWLLDPVVKKPPEVIVALASEDILWRKYAAVVAARISETDREPLLRAASITDPDIKDFVDSRIKLL